MYAKSSDAHDWLTGARLMRTMLDRDIWSISMIHILALTCLALAARTILGWVGLDKKNKHANDAQVTTYTYLSGACCPQMMNPVCSQHGWQETGIALVQDVAWGSFPSGIMERDIWYYTEHPHILCLWCVQVYESYSPWGKVCISEARAGQHQTW